MNIKKKYNYEMMIYEKIMKNSTNIKNLCLIIIELANLLQNDDDFHKEIAKNGLILICQFINPKKECIEYIEFIDNKSTIEYCNSLLINLI